jgi:hypothetical protein
LKVNCRLTGRYSDSRVRISPEKPACGKFAVTIAATAELSLGVIEGMIEEAGVKFPALESRGVHDSAMEGDGGFHAFTDEHFEGAAEGPEL